MDAYGSVTFREVQRFNQKWLWAIVILDAIWIVGLMVFTPFQKGDNASAPQMIITIAIVALAAGGPIALMLIMNMTTEVRTDGLYVRFFPFHLSFRKIALENLKSCEPRTYDPLGEYGGWGLRHGRGGRAYNVNGNRGVQLEYQDGKRLLIGSQKPEELTEAVQQVAG